MRLGFVNLKIFWVLICCSLEDFGVLDLKICGSSIWRFGVKPYVVLSVLVGSGLILDLPAKRVMAMAVGGDVGRA